jgi:predicted flap endonuclease-1-like 5' DNA nuclease
MGIPTYRLRGLSSTLQEKLRAMGILNSDQLLDATRTPSGRKALAAQVGADPRLILDLANRADLARVKGVGGVFSDLLEQAGVDTVKELAVRRADNLYAKLAETNADEKVAGRLPTEKAVQSWVAQAKALPKLLEY